MPVGFLNHTTSMSDQTTWKPPRMISGMMKHRDQEVFRQLGEPQLKPPASNQMCVRESGKSSFDAAAHDLGDDGAPQPRYLPPVGGAPVVALCIRMTNDVRERRRLVGRHPHDLHTWFTQQSCGRFQPTRSHEELPANCNRQQECLDAHLALPAAFQKKGLTAGSWLRGTTASLDLSIWSKMHCTLPPGVCQPTIRRLGMECIRTVRLAPEAGLPP